MAAASVSTSFSTDNWDLFLARSILVFKHIKDSKIKSFSIQSRLPYSLAIEMGFKSRGTDQKWIDFEDTYNHPTTTVEFLTEAKEAAFYIKISSMFLAKCLELQDVQNAMNFEFQTNQPLVCKEVTVTYKHQGDLDQLTTMTYREVFPVQATAAAAVQTKNKP